MENSFELSGRQYKLRKIDAFQQFHIVRRIAPILSELLPAIGEIQKVSKTAKSETENFDQIAKILSPIMLGFSKLSDSEADKVLFGLLSSVEVQIAGTSGWTRVATPSSLMVQDMELSQMLNVAGRAFMFNLSGFFPVLPQVT